MRRCYKLLRKSNPIKIEEIRKVFANFFWGGNFENHPLFFTIPMDTLTHTKQSFNKIAGEYDLRDNANPILQWMRGVVHKVYLQHLSKNAKVLELNAGTGVDAIFLAQKGMSVFATDISDNMIMKAMSNVKAQMPNADIKFEVLGFNEIDRLNDSGFDAVVSNFGGLNCIDDFTKLSTDLAAKLKQGGKFIAVVMNRICPWEIFYYCVRFDLKNAFRRFKKEGVMAELNGEKVLTYYFSPRQFAEQFNENFTLEKVYTLGYYTPPPYLAGVYNKLKPIVKIFMNVDEIIKGLPFFRSFGDHYIVVMRKTIRNDQE